MQFYQPRFIQLETHIASREDECERQRTSLAPPKNFLFPLGQYFSGYSAQTTSRTILVRIHSRVVTIVKTQALG